MTDSTDPLNPVTAHSVAQDLLDYIGTRDLCGGVPTQPRPEDGGDGLAVTAGHESGSGGEGLPVWLRAHLFEVLRDRAIQVETDLAERRHIYRTGLSYGMATYIDNDGHLASGVSAIIDDNAATVILNLEDPAVQDIVLGGAQRPLRDQIRVTSELVRLYRDAVCLLGLPDGLRGNVIRGFRESVAVLGDLVRDGGPPQGRNAGDSTDQTCERPGARCNVAEIHHASVDARPPIRVSPGNPPAGDTQPAGPGGPPPAPGAGGHPIEPTSELLQQAAVEIQSLGLMAYSTRQPWIEGFAADLRDRAAQFRAVND